MKKTLLLMLAVLAMAINASAENYILYTSSDGRIVNPNNPEAFGATIVSNTYEDGQGKIVFDGDVTSIGDDAFAWSGSDLTSVVIPNTVTSIGICAFDHCYSLTSVEIPNSVTSIGVYAFICCYDLRSVEIPNSVTSIGDGAFMCCYSLASFSGKFASEDNCCLIVDGVLSSFAPAGLTSYTIPNTVKTIGNYAFANCVELTSVTIPNSVTTIGDYAFAFDCGFGYVSSLTSVEIPNSVTSIGKYAFAGCTSLISVEIPNSVTSIGDEAFYYCESLTSVEIPNSVTSIGGGVFRFCSSLASVEIPNSVTSIGESAFADCSSLASVEIPNSVTAIGEYAFRDCSSLTSVVIPNSVTWIRRYAFSGCSSLKEITSLAVTPPSIYSDTFDGVSKKECVLKVLEESVEAYKAAYYWKDFLNIEGIKATGISTPFVNNFRTSGKAYNLNGAATNDGYRGIVIQNGKKLLRK